MNKNKLLWLTICINYLHLLRKTLQNHFQLLKNYGQFLIDLMDLIVCLTVMFLYLFSLIDFYRLFRNKLSLFAQMSFRHENFLQKNSLILVVADLIIDPFATLLNTFWRLVISLKIISVNFFFAVSNSLKVFPDLTRCLTREARIDIDIYVMQIFSNLVFYSESHMKQYKNLLF